MKAKRNLVPIPELLDALAPIVRPAMLEQFRPDCCVDTCIVLRRVFRTFGFSRILSPSPSESSTRICCDFFRIEFSSQMIDRNALSFARERGHGA